MTKTQQHETLSKIGLGGMPIDSQSSMVTFSKDHTGSFPGARAFQIMSQIEYEKYQFDQVKVCKKTLCDIVLGKICWYE